MTDAAGTLSPSGTANFVLSLKQPLASRLRQAGDNPEEAFDETWAVSALLDKPALLTTEIYQQSREELIIRQQVDMLALSTAVVKIRDGIVALPLIGTLDSALGFISPVEFEKQSNLN